MGVLRGRLGMLGGLGGGISGPVMSRHFTACCKSGIYSIRSKAKAGERAEREREL